MNMTRRTLVASLEKIHGTKTTMEMIGFQMFDKFGSDMEALCTTYEEMVNQGMSAKAISNAAINKEFEDLIFKRFGLRMELFTNSHIAAIIPNMYVPNNMVLSDYMRDYAKDRNIDFLPGAKALIRSGTGIKGHVDIRNAKVSGWFSQQVSPIFINFKQLFKDCDMTPAEVTSIILHEIGHGFNAVMYLDRTNTTNQIIADVAKHIHDKTKSKDVAYIYREILKVHPEATQDLVEGLASEEATVVGAATYRLLIGVSQSLMMDKTYDRVSFEALSDNFAARFGYGEHFVVGFEKFEKLMPEKDSELVQGIMDTVALAYTSYSAALCAVFILCTPLSAGMLITAAWGLLMGFCAKSIAGKYGAEGKDRIYDSVRLRYVRVRSQIVEFIKDPTISNDIRKNMLNQIETIDAVLKDKPAYEFFLHSMANHIFPKDRRAKHSIEEQQRMELLISNDIFVQANRLKLVA